MRKRCGPFFMPSKLCGSGPLQGAAFGGRLHPPVNQHQVANAGQHQQLPPATSADVVQATCAYGQRWQQQTQHDQSAFLIIWIES